MQGIAALSLNKKPYATWAHWGIFCQRRKIVKISREPTMTMHWIFVLTSAGCERKNQWRIAPLDATGLPHLWRF
jgi:hypothetical protein